VLACLHLSPSFYTEGNSYDFTVKTVVIDAGHGGKDSGCLGAKSKEKDVTLAIALKIGKYIKEYVPGVKVLYTRTNDKFIELHERARIANRNKADLFLSVHCNSSRHKDRVSGTETYVMGLDKSSENLEVARRENAVVLLENDHQKHYDGFDANKPESHIVFSLYQNAYLNQSIELASLIESQFKNRARRKSRGVKQESFLVLYKTAMPSVLIETGFLTHKKEEQYLNSEQGQSYIASAVYRAFKDYKYGMEGKKDSGRGISIPEDNFYDSLGNLPAANIEEACASNRTYKIQLYDAYESVDLGNPDFDMVSKIDIEETQNGIKQYLVAQQFHEHYMATEMLRKMRSAGFKHARIITYEHGERVAMN